LFWHYFRQNFNYKEFPLVSNNSKITKCFGAPLFSTILTRKQGGEMSELPDDVITYAGASLYSAILTRKQGGEKLPFSMTSSPMLELLSSPPFSPGSRVERSCPSV
jgi:hypothetical protein